MRSIPNFSTVVSHFWGYNVLLDTLLERYFCLCRRFQLGRAFLESLSLGLAWVFMVFFSIELMMLLFEVVNFVLWPFFCSSIGFWTLFCPFLSVYVDCVVRPCSPKGECMRRGYGVKGGG
ncbi:hypothetical protein BDN70DRAFT_605426 [Pholiota conissans]|uniref:Uncharacterized protein n=1 Tax=Pholiota conissans TaxID=109636 RepID=A0A9P5YNK5_9AGAR|nr:hypothetical protein BDN70DRAFT_605426 [Pholiota conissans]